MVSDAPISMGQEGFEACDDGNEDDGDGCVGDCQVARCGDGYVQRGEEACDDGNQVQTDGCLNDCSTSRCGDQIVGPGEACDDGNQVNDDGCTNRCALPGCGDGFVQNDEECDDANEDNTDACLNSCLNATCGDGVLRGDLQEGQGGYEACDDGNRRKIRMAVQAAGGCGDGAVAMAMYELALKIAMIMSADDDACPRGRTACRFCDGDACPSTRDRFS